MDIKAEDFPLYQILDQLGMEGISSARKAFAAAVSGGDSEKYSFALGIQTLAVTVPAGQIPGVTEDVKRKTLRSCLAVFREVAQGTSAQAKNAKFMVEHFRKNKYGL